MRVAYYGLPYFLDKLEVSKYVKSIIDSLSRPNINYEKMILVEEELYDIYDHRAEENEKELINMYTVKKLDRTYKDKIIFNNIIRSYNVDTYHCLHNGFSINNEIKVNKVCNINTTLPLTDSEIINQEFNLKYMDNIMKIKRENTKVVVPYKFMKEELLYFFNCEDENIYVDIPSIDISNLGLGKAISKAYILSKFNISFNYYIYIGEINNRNNLLDTIRIFSKLEGKSNNKLILILRYINKNIHLIRELLECIDRLSLTDKIIFLNNLTYEDEKNLINGAEAFLYLNRYDELNLTIIDCLILNTKLITYPTRSNLEYLEDYPVYITNYMEALDVDISNMEYYETELANRNINNKILSKFTKNNSSMFYETLYNR